MGGQRTNLSAQRRVLVTNQQAKRKLNSPISSVHSDEKSFHVFFSPKFLWAPRKDKRELIIKKCHNLSKEPHESSCFSIYIYNIYIHMYDKKFNKGSVGQDRVTAQGTLSFPTPWIYIYISLAISGNLPFRETSLKSANNYMRKKPRTSFIFLGLKQDSSFQYDFFRGGKKRKEFRVPFWIFWKIVVFFSLEEREKRNCYYEKVASFLYCG